MNGSQVVLEGPCIALHIPHLIMEAQQLQAQ